MTDAKKISVLALLTGAGLIAFLLEALLSPLLPGTKLGISNLFSLLALSLYGLREAFLVITARTVLGSLFAGNPSLLLYSFPAGVAGILAARLLLPRASTVAASVASAVVHNLTELTIFILLTGTDLLAYAPFLILSGVLSGAFVGLCAVVAFRRLPRKEKA